MTKKIKVLRIINRLNLGGPTYNATFLTRFMSDEFDTTLLAGMKDESEASSTFILDQYDVKATLIPDMHRSIHPIKDWKAFWHIYKIIKKEKPDVVHTHAAKAGFLGRFVAWVCGVEVIIHTYHGHVFSGYFGKMKTNLFLFLERQLGKRSSKLIALSPEQHHDLVDVYKIAPKDRFEIINLGFDLEKYRQNYEEKRASFREQFGIQDDELAIGIIGRLVPIKNHHLFFDALDHVLKNTKKKIKAVVVGDGELRGELTSYLESKNMNYAEFDIAKEPGEVVFTSWQKEIDWVNAGLDIVALSSDNEGTPVSLIEAQASGNPIVSTKVGGIKDIVKENETALLSDKGDVQAFSENLLELVENDELRQQMSGNGVHVFQQFSYERLCRDMERLYKQELKEN